MDAFWTAIHWLCIGIGMVLVAYGLAGLVAVLLRPGLLNGRVFNERAIGRGPRTRSRLIPLFTWSAAWGTYMVLNAMDLGAHWFRMTLLGLCTVLVYFAFVRKYT